MKDLLSFITTAIGKGSIIKGFVERLTKYLISNEAKRKVERYREKLIDEGITKDNVDEHEDFILNFFCEHIIELGFADNDWIEKGVLKTFFLDEIKEMVKEELGKR